MRISISGNYTGRIKMKVNVASAVKNIVNWAFPLFFFFGVVCCILFTMITEITVQRLKNSY